MQLQMALQISLLITVLFTSGCASIRNMFPNSLSGEESGQAWCSDRYLDMNEYLKTPEIAGSAFRKRIELSEQGYLYALIAAYTLQGKPEHARHAFILPEYVSRLDQYTADDPSTGFHAESFLVTNPTTHKKVVVIGFRGTDGPPDWRLHNAAIFFKPRQFAPARAYVEKVRQTKEAEGLDIIVAGFSLGGGLAVHVTQEPSTATFVKQAWAFNTSPRTGVPRKEDPRIYMLSVKDEVLGLIRRNSVGAPINHVAEDFDLIKSSSWYAHSRWVLTRQMLQFADLSLFYKSDKTAELTPPLEILKANKSTACRPEDAAAIARKRAQAQAIN